jgi:hypothetical protein
MHVWLLVVFSHQYCRLMRRRNGRHGQGETGHGATFRIIGGVFRRFAFDIKRPDGAVFAYDMDITNCVTGAGGSAGKNQKNGKNQVQETHGV